MSLLERGGFESKVTDYVCPQCGPDKNGSEIHTLTHHMLPPCTVEEARRVLNGEGFDVDDTPPPTLAELTAKVKGYDAAVKRCEEYHKAIVVLRNEVNCRREHGACGEDNLKYIEDCLTDMLAEAEKGVKG